MTNIENARIQKSKKKAREYIEKEQLVSFMNNTNEEDCVLKRLYMMLKKSF